MSIFKAVGKRLQGDQKGFSLIELIVVIAIIGILVMLAAPRFLGYTKDAQVAGLKTDVKILSDAAILYNIENPGQWPIEDPEVAIDVSEKGINEQIKDSLDADVEVYKIDKTKLEGYIKNIKNDFDDYGLALSKEFEGEVFHLDGMADRAGKTWFGTDLGVVLD